MTCKHRNQRSVALKFIVACIILCLEMTFKSITGFCASETWHSYSKSEAFTTDCIIEYEGKALYNFNDTVAVGSGIRKTDDVVPVEADYGFIAKVKNNNTVSITAYDYTNSNISPVRITVERPTGMSTTDLKGNKKCSVNGYSNYPNGFGYITIDFSTGKSLNIAILKDYKNLYVCNVEDHPLNAKAIVTYRQTIQDKMDEAGITIQNATKTNPIYYPIVPQPGEADDVDFWLNTADNITDDSWTDAHKVVTFYNYIIDNIAYDKYVISKGFHARWKMYKSYDGSQYISTTKVGVCQDVAEIFCIMCREEGIPAVVVAADGHAWAHVYITDYNRWISVDATKDMKYYAYQEDVTQRTFSDNKKYSHVDDTNSLIDFDHVGIGNYEDMKLFGITE